MLKVLETIKLKKRWAIGYALIFTAIVGGIGIFWSNSVQKEHLKREIGREIEITKSFIELSLQNSVKYYRENIKNFINKDERVLNSLKNRDFEAIKIYSEEIISEIRNGDKDFSSLNFIASNGDFLYKSLNPDSLNDKANEDLSSILTKVKDSGNIVERVNSEIYNLAGDCFKIVSPIFSNGDFLGAVEISFSLSEKLKNLKSLSSLYEKLDLNLIFGGILVEKESVNNFIDNENNNNSKYIKLNLSKEMNSLFEQKKLSLEDFSKTDNFQKDLNERVLYIFSYSPTKNSRVIYILDATNKAKFYNSFTFKLSILTLLLIILVYFISEFNWRYFVLEAKKGISHLDKIASENREVEELFENGKSAIVRVSTIDFEIETISNSIKDLTGFGKGDIQNLRELFFSEDQFNEFSYKIDLAFQRQLHSITFQDIVFKGRDNSGIFVDVQVLVSYNKHLLKDTTLLLINEVSERNYLHQKIHIFKDRFKFISSSIEQNFWEVDLKREKIYTSIEKGNFLKTDRDILITALTKLDIPKIDNFIFIHNDREKFYEDSFKEFFLESYSKDFQLEFDKPNQRLELNKPISRIEIIGKEIFNGDEVVKIVGITKETTLEKEEDVPKLKVLANILKRVELEEILSREVERSRRYKNRLSIIFFDVDDFNEIEKLEGALETEKILADLIKEFNYLKRTTDLLGRWSKSEFLFIAFETELESAKIFAEKLRERTKNKIFQNGVKLSCSFGVEEFNLRYDKNIFIQKAHKLVVSAKKEGGNQVKSGEMFSEFNL
jgi:diguanylate cyclase (GGDEF)-like protein